MQRFRSLVLIGSALLGLSMGLRAQQQNVGNITGSVSDPSGAVIPDAKVVAVNPATAISQTTATSSAGIYHIDRLQVGRYNVTVTKDGFKTEERTDIEVIAGEAFTVNFVMSVGATTQTITVSGAPPVVNSTDTMQGTTRTVEEIADLPVSMEGNAEREAISTVQTLAGVNYNLRGNAGQGWMVVSRSAINGINGGGFGFEIDGLEAAPGEPEQEEDFISPVPDIVQEVRMTAGTDASQGFNAGVKLELVTKSGTNQFHGSLYEYNRNAALESRDFFLPKIGEDNQNQWGWTLGGPVYIPHVYDGRNKTFFYADMDFFRWNTVQITSGGAEVATVPTAAEEQGDFSALLGPQIGTDGLGKPIYQYEIYDPQTTRQLSNGTFVRDPFMYQGHLNVIPPNRLSKVSQFFQTGYAAPLTSGFVNNWTGPNSLSVNPDQHYNVKIDQQIGDKQHLTFAIDREFGWFFPNQYRPPAEQGVGCFGDHIRYSGYPLFTGGPIADSGSADCRDEYRYRLIYTWTARPDLLFSFRIGVTRDPKRNQVDLPSSILNGAAQAGLTGDLSPETPQLCINGSYGCVGAQGGQFPEEDHSERLPASLDISWTKGRHLFSFGVQYTYLNYLGVEFYQTHGAYSFSNNETGLSAEPNSSEIGWPYASFLLGEVDSASVGTVESSGIISGTGAVYAQDKWQVTPKLTVTYGLRWEVSPPAHVQDNRIGTFDPSIPNPAAGDIPGALSFYGVGAGKNGMIGVGPWYMKAFAPKIGIAYAMNPKTVFRANYGVSYFPYSAKWYNDTINMLPEYGYQDEITKSSLNGGYTSAFNWSSGFPGVFPATLPVTNPSLENGSNVQYIDTNNNRPPMVQNIGVEVERQLPSSILLRVSYVGNLSHRDYGGYSMNLYPIGDLALGNLLNDSISSPQAIAAGIKSPYPGFTGPVSQALRPYPQYTGVSDIGGQLANADFNSLQINVQRHFGTSLTFLGNFTFAKMMDMASFPCGCEPAASTNLNSPWGTQTLQDAHELSNQDIARTINLSWYWAMPVGRGQHFLANASKPLDYLVGNWRWSAIQSYQSGRPIGISADLNQGVPIRAGSGCGSIQPKNPGQDVYLSPAAFSQPAPFTIANTSELPSVRGCGYFDEDLGLSKGFPFGESRRVEVGTMVTNLFNRHALGGLNTSVGNPAFGQFSSNNIYPRTVQLYMKFAF